MVDAKPTRAQRRALAVLGAYTPLGATCRELATGMWGIASAANAGKAVALLRRMERAGFVRREQHSKLDEYSAYWILTRAGDQAFHGRRVGTRGRGQA